ncbi:MAG: hypothetical protein BWY31_02279 [Lentisphaerae bacterium ADurb.Bin242]|nr:MAG: hypothetical protein BWY31_02279 [Lentisphaerae bacterium ADurb.Bin242]
MKISFFNQEITPEIGSEIAGYAPHDISLGVHDPLYVNGLLLDDGENKALMLGFDLLGLDASFLAEIRKQCGKKLHISESQVMATCTHTHSGPQTRTHAGCDPDLAYIAKLMEWMEHGLDRLSEPQEVNVYYYSVNCDANLNRRVVYPDAECCFLPHFKELLPFADGPCDKELGMLFFFNGNGMPVYTVVNYAAHPLCSHAAGKASLLFSADYPGAVRRIIKENTGSECMFISGAAGDMFPKNYESGWEGVESMGRLLADKVLENMQNVRRQKNLFSSDPAASRKARYAIETPRLNFSIETVKFTPAEEKMRKYRRTGSEVLMELQFLSLNDDICFVGLPGELLAEPGLEIKWHSPYRKMFLLYNSTGYSYYLPHGHCILEGGYEGKATFLGPRDGLKLVNAVVDGMYRLKET